MGIKFSKQNRAFYPTNIDIRNYIYAAKKTFELSKLDQEDVRLMVEQHKKDDPTSSFFSALSLSKKWSLSRDVMIHV